jgi:hypothetical protein
VEADARTLLTLVGPLAIMYMTYSSVQSTAVAGKAANLKSIPLGPITAPPKLPSSEAKLRNPFVPRHGAKPAHEDDAQNADPEKSDQPLHLNGTAMIGKTRFAIINGIRVVEGDYFRGLRLTAVGATEVTLVGEGQEVVLPLEIAKSDRIRIPSPLGTGSDRSQRPQAPESSKTAQDTVKEP